MRMFMHQLTVAFVCLLVGFSPVHAKKSPKASGFGGMKTSPNLSITLSTGGSKGSAGRTRKTRKSGKRSSRHRKTQLPVI
jgi:hypothetical protein